MSNDWTYENLFCGVYIAHNQFMGWREVTIVDDFGFLRIVQHIPTVMYFLVQEH